MYIHIHTTVFLDTSKNGQCSTRLTFNTNELDCELVMLHCDECGENVSVDSWDEHTDHHVAMQLHKSINQSSPAIVSSSPQPIERKTDNKRTPKTKMASKKTKLLTLDKFLAKK